MTLSSSEAEFVAASQAGQEVVYLSTLLRGFGYPQRGAPEIWEDNASCIMMSENPSKDTGKFDLGFLYHHFREFGFRERWDMLLILEVDEENSFRVFRI